MDVVLALRFSPLLLIYIGIFPSEALHPPSGINELLLSCEKRMALGTDFDIYILNCGACFKFIATRAVHGRYMIFWVYTFFHSLFPSPVVTL